MLLFLQRDDIISNIGDWNYLLILEDTHQFVVGRHEGKHHAHAEEPEERGAQHDGQSPGDRRRGPLHSPTWKMRTSWVLQNQVAAVRWWHKFVFS